MDIETGRTTVPVCPSNKKMNQLGLYKAVCACVSACLTKGKTVSIDNSTERSPVCIMSRDSFVFIDKRT